MEMIVNLHAEIASHALTEGFALAKAMSFMRRALERGVPMADMVLLLLKSENPLWAIVSADANSRHFPESGEARTLVGRAWIAPYIIQLCGTPPEFVRPLGPREILLVLAGAHATSIQRFEFTATPIASMPIAPTRRSDLN